jgi:hypothetical protein
MFAVCSNERSFADRAMDQSIRLVCLYFHTHNPIARLATWTDEVNGVTLGVWAGLGHHSILFHQAVIN